MCVIVHCGRMPSDLTHFLSLHPLSPLSRSHPGTLSRQHSQSLLLPAPPPSFQTHHPGWTHVFWDAASARRLLRERYPWFLPTWENYTSTVLKSDSLRAFLLHAFGGVYLDLDTECFRPMDDSLTGGEQTFQILPMDTECVPANGRQPFQILPRDGSFGFCPWSAHGQQMFQILPMDIKCFRPMSDSLIGGKTMPQILTA